MEALTLNFHMARYKGLLSVPNEETKASAKTNALIDHQLAVRIELGKLTSRAVTTAYQLTNSKAQQYMMYGVGRRLRMLLISYCNIFNTIAPDRTEPLPLDDMAMISGDLKMVYINIRGTLDNYAWYLHHERDIGKSAKLKNSKIGLFLTKFRKHLGLTSLKAVLDSNHAWNEGLSSRRDPSAHRMPLSDVFST